LLSFTDSGNGQYKIKENADRILYEFGLLSKIEQIGKAHIVGSYQMDMMAWNDLDIDIENALSTT